MTNPAFFDAVRTSVFGGSLSQGQVDGLTTIINAWNTLGDGDGRKLAYILATTFHETARTMQPVRETLAKSDAKAKEILTKAWKSGKLKWVKSDYWSSGYFGRGYVQLTWRDNYAKAGKKLGLDLVGNPSLALQPGPASHILIRGMMEGWFTGKKLSDYINDERTGYINARKVVNGSDRQELIAGYADKFDDAVRLLEKPAQPVNPKPTPLPPISEEKPPKGIAGVVALILAAIGAAITKFIGIW